MAQAARQRWRRSPWEEPEEGCTASMVADSHWSDSGGCSPHCSHRDRGRRGIAARQLEALGATFVVYLVVTSHILCRQSRLRFDWRAGFECGTRLHAATASRSATRGSYGSPSPGTLGGAWSNDSITTRELDGRPICQASGLLADGEIVSECSPPAAARSDTCCSGDVRPHFGPVQLRAVDSPGMVIPKSTARTWWAVCGLHTPFSLRPGPCASSSHDALPICTGGAQHARQRAVGVRYSLGAGIGISCIHAHCRDILLQWSLAVCILVLLSGVVWGLSRLKYTRGGLRSTASVVHRFCQVAAAALCSCKIGHCCGRHCSHVHSQRTCRPTYPRQRSERCLRSKGCFMLWLLLTPQAHGVQVLRQGTIHGQPVFNTGTVPGTRNLQDLRPVRLPNLPVTGARAAGPDDGYREVCVFAPDLRTCHTTLLVDVRLRGRALEVSICRALGRQAAEWGVLPAPRSIASISAGAVCLASYFSVVAP